MRILVAGNAGRGQLSRALVEAAGLQNGITLTALGRPQLNLLDRSTLSQAFEAVKPDVVVNAAAYTAVDKAEGETAMAFAVNRDGAASLAAAALSHGCPIVHVSTDYVFDGTKPRPYVESDAPNPICAYGCSKYEGELAVAEANPRHLILRTSWVYAPYGQNFFLTVLRLSRERSHLRIVADQQGTPTYAPHLAQAILALVPRLNANLSSENWGVYHATSGGQATWAEFAAAILAETARPNKPTVTVAPIAAVEYPAVARRPANSRLNCGKLERIFGVRLPPWREGVEECVASLKRASGT